MVFFVGSIFFTSAAALQWLETINADPGPRSPSREAPRAHVRAAPHRLVEQRRPARRDRLLQLHDLPRAAGRPRCRCVRPPRLEARRCSARSASSSRAISPTSRCAAMRSGRASGRSSGRSQRSTSSAASRSASRRSPRSGCLDSGGVLALAASNWFTALGGLCFLVGAIMLLPESAATDAVESSGAALYAHP